MKFLLVIHQMLFVSLNNGLNNTLLYEQISKHYTLD